MPTTDQGTCETCGASFTGVRSGNKPRRFCSGTCYHARPQPTEQIRKRVEKTQVTKAETRERREVTGQSTHGLYGKKQDPEHVKFRIATAQKRLAEKIRQCVECGEDFTPDMAAQKYCTNRCYQRVHRRRRAAQRPSLRLKIDPELRRALEYEQGYACAICRVPQEHRRLANDHDHQTGQIRGLLCSGCNTGLGLFGDDPARLRVAADYIESHR